MRPVYLNMRFLTQPLSGMQRYSEELIGALDERLSRDPDHLGGARVVGLAPSATLRDRNWRAIELRRIGRLKGHAWEQVELAHAARDGVLVSLAGSGPIAHPRQIVAIHDANLYVNPRFYSRAYRVLHGFIRPRLARRAKVLITISEFSRRELARSFDLPEDRFKIVPDSAEHILTVPSDVEVLGKHGLQTGRYALCVGNQSPNKNIALAIDAFAGTGAAERMRLAIAGGTPAALAKAETREAPWLSVLGRVTDGELRALYEHAAFFVFPSIYEGFGVPPLEAMSLGCPVISSDSSAMPEVLGEAAFFFVSGDVDACAEKIRQMLALDDARRQSLVTAGKERAARFRWTNSEHLLSEAIRDLEAA